MRLPLEYLDGQTSLSEEDMDGLLIPSVTTRGELDEFEQLNIEKAIAWVMKKKFKPAEILTEEFVKRLHAKMFGDTWAWAGQFRKTGVNFGVDKQLIGTALGQLLGNCAFWIEHQTFPHNEIAIHFSHKIVSIHCFANGNGRHSRLIADILMENVFGQPHFSWGSSQLKKGEARSQYLKALREADLGNIQPLIIFAKT